jgi:hypothetical protein
MPPKDPHIQIIKNETIKCSFCSKDAKYRDILLDQTIYRCQNELCIEWFQWMRGKGPLPRDFYERFNKSI